MFVKIEFDLKITSSIRDRSRRQTSRRDIQRHVPPVIDTRMRSQTYLADDLQIEMQRVLRRPPGVKRHFGEKFGVAHTIQVQRRFSSTAISLIRQRLVEPVVLVTKAPTFAGLERFDHRMSACVKVLGRVPVDRIVAAPDVPAHSTEPQVHPSITGFEAFLAACRTWFYRQYGLDMFAIFHLKSSYKSVSDNLTLRRTSTQILKQIR